MTFVAADYLVAGGIPAHGYALASGPEGLADGEDYIFDAEGGGLLVLVEDEGEYRFEVAATNSAGTNTIAWVLTVAEGLPLRPGPGRRVPRPRHPRDDERHGRRRHLVRRTHGPRHSVGGMERVKKRQSANRPLTDKEGIAMVARRYGTAIEKTREAQGPRTPHQAAQGACARGQGQGVKSRPAALPSARRTAA